MGRGFPQGSVIGLLMFLLFVNDLPNALEAPVLLFADDVKMVTWRPQNESFHSSFITAGGEPSN